MSSGLAIERRVASIAERRWKGIGRDDGRIGVRDLVLVIYTVQCAQHVAHGIANSYGKEVQVVGFPGCYDNQFAVDLLLALARHPNVGAVLAVGLGCEYVQPERIAQVAAESGRRSDWFYIQDVGGTSAGIERGREIVGSMLAHLARERDGRLVTMGVGDLMVGAECGGSDATSGLAANPCVGRVFDRIVDLGGTAIWEEIVEMIGLREALVRRGVNAEARREIGEAYDKAEAYCKSVQQYSVSPGNFAGGLTTIEEKSLGSYAKSGSREIRGVIKVCERPRSAGLWLLDSVPDRHYMQFGYSNPNDNEGLMDLIASGCQILYYTTGRGSCTGSVVAPVVKVTGNSATYRKLEADMDFDAGRALTDEISPEEVALELLELTCDVAAGAETKPERLGHQEYFVMFKYQDRATAGCRG